MKNLISVFFIFLLASCISVPSQTQFIGKQISEEEINQLKIGATTYSEAVALFGAPKFTSTQKDLTIVNYSYGVVGYDATSLSPISGIQGGRTSIHAKTLTLSFDKNNVLTDVAKSEYNSGDTSEVKTVK